MNNLNTLIEQYWAGELKPSDRLLLVELLEEKAADSSDEEYRTFIELVSVEQTLLNKQDPALKERMMAIRSRLNFEENAQAPVRDAPVPVFNIPRKTRWPWLAAASIAAITMSIWWMAANHSTNKPVIAGKGPMWVTISTGESAVKDTTMPDGSIIKMYAGTSVSFIDGFKEKERKIKLNGKALFEVAGDISRPFIVYAGGFTTTALGTEFEINTQQKGRFSARLLNGKVVVKTEDKAVQPMEDVYLLPNEQLEYDLLTKTARLNRDNSAAKAEGKIESEKEKKEAAPDLAFSKLPLPVVFKMLEDEYAIVIVYDTDKVSGMEYSGRFKKSADPFSILKKITRQYNLKLRKESRTYKIE